MLTLQGSAQEIYTGTWKYYNNNKDKSFPIRAELKIGTPEKNILYPATLKVECDSFIGVYKLLLAIKNPGKLAISKNKIPITESPFSIGNSTNFCIGSLELKKDISENLFLELNRLHSGIKFNINQLKLNSALQEKILKELIQFFSDDQLKFKKSDSEKLEQPIAQTILHPSEKRDYYGLIDTLFVKSNSAIVSFKKNNDNDLVSMRLNDDVVFDQLDSKKKREEEEIVLDTGLNIICFFADDFGNNVTQGAAVKLMFENYSKLLSFNETLNQNSNFIAARIFIKSAGDGQNEMISFKETIDSSINNITKKSGNDKPSFSLSYSNRDNKIAGDFVTTSPQLTFAIWDDAIEDGDSISLSLNDEWITRTFAVKKNPQFITVTLRPGSNIITFVANNLGGIPPNTSVLEIIDGKKRKSYFIQTDMNQNNLVKILYDTNR